MLETDIYNFKKLINKLINYEYSKCINLNLSKLKKVIRIKKVEKFQKDNRKKHVETMFIANKQKNYLYCFKSLNNFSEVITNKSITNFIKYDEKRRNDNLWYTEKLKILELNMNKSTQNYLNIFYLVRNAN